MDMDDFHQLTDFGFDPSTPSSDEEDVHERPPSQGPPRLRKAASNNRVVRKRARKACVACHNRKVRCDVISRGHICTNCRLDGKTCVIRPGKRARVETPTRPDDIHVGDPIDFPGTSSALLDASGFPFASFSNNANPIIVPPFDAGASPFPTKSSLTLHPDMIYTYFDFIEAETFSHIAPEDFKFLEFKGCFHLPARSILDRVVRQYFLHVHPALPIIDERAFWEMYFPREGGAKRSPPKRITLFVLRAMLFVACSFVSDDTIRQLGFQTTIEARTSMYRRAKLLYDFDTTSDPIALAQGTLLLTYYCSEREPCANTSWLRLSVQYANSANAAMYSHDTTISAEERLVRKRLWWCIILRDRILPLGVRRSIQIARSNFDFSLPRLCEKDLEPEFRGSCVYDPETKRDLARVFLTQLGLAVELTDALSYVYPAHGFHSFDRLEHDEVISMPKKIEKCRDNLDAWHARCKEWIEPGAWSGKHTSVMLFSGLTSIYFQSARAALCQFESFMLQADDSKQHDSRMKELGSALHSAVASISETIRAFVQLDVAKYLPVSAVAYLALPIILNSLDLQIASSSTHAPRSEEKRRQLRLLTDVMDLIKNRYTGALGGMDIIKKTIETARLESYAASLSCPRPSSPSRADSSGLHPSPGMDSSSPSSAPPAKPQAEPQDWFDVFVRQPDAYLRLSFAVDMSLSVGRYPSTADLPRRISLLPPSQTLSLPAGRLGEEAFEDTDGAAAARACNLDFLDFGQSGSSQRGESASDRNPWNGKTVERILEEVLGGGGRLWGGEEGEGEGEGE